MSSFRDVFKHPQVEPVPLSYVLDTVLNGLQAMNGTAVVVERTGCVWHMRYADGGLWPLTCQTPSLMRIDPERESQFRQASSRQDAWRQLKALIRGDGGSGGGGAVSVALKFQVGDPGTSRIQYQKSELGHRRVWLRRDIDMSQ